MENLIAVLYPVKSEAYESFVELKSLPYNESSTIAQAVLVKKENNIVTAQETYSPVGAVGDSVWQGGLVGSLLGIVGGPLGVLLGAGIGTMVGVAADSTETLDNLSLLEIITQKLENDDVAIILIVDEKDESILDDYFTKKNASVLRWDVATINQEMIDSLKMQETLYHQAKAEIKSNKSKERKELFQEFKDDIKKYFDKLKK